MELITSKVFFNEPEHTYWLGERRLKGISHLYGKHVNPDKYKGIPEFVLKRAAEKGSAVHEACRLADMFGIAETQEAINYLNLREFYGINPMANEYLVSDEQEFATMIDMVGDDFSLYDFKTTSILDEESLSWQLSICAVLFEKQNPTLKANKLFGIWLRDGISKLVEIRKIPEDVILELLRCEISGEVFDNPIKTIVPVDVNEALVKLSEFESFVQIAEVELNEKKEKMAAIKEYLLTQMVANSVKKYESDNISVTYVAPMERKSVDSATLKSEMPEVYDKYLKTSQIKESIRIKIK